MRLEQSATTRGTNASMIHTPGNGGFALAQTQARSIRSGSGDVKGFVSGGEGRDGLQFVFVGQDGEAVFG